jgi:hypothetical protein
MMEFLEETSQDYRVSILPMMNKAYSSPMMYTPSPNIIDEKHLMPRPYSLSYKYSSPKLCSTESRFLPYKPDKYKKIMTKDVRSLKESWTQREKKMYLAETSLIFGTDDVKEYEKWCYALEHVLNIEVIKY